MVPKFEFSSHKLFVVNIISGVALLIAVLSAFFFYSQYRKSLAVKNIPAAEIETTAAAVARLIELPEEAPTLATVSDVDKLKDQDFFRRAQNGDKVLIFKNAKKAILYRPFTNKIIEVGPIKVDEPVTVVPSVLPTASSEAVLVVVYNGTKTTGLSKKTADQLSKEFSDIKIKSTGNAAGEYEKTVVVDLSKKQKAKAASIAKFLKGEVGSLPAGETGPEADILIILGSGE